MMPCAQLSTSCPAIAIQSSASRTAPSEELTFLYQSLTGDSEVIARVMTMSGGGLEGASGVSVRTGLAPGAPAVTLWLTRSGQLALDSRQKAGGATARRLFKSPQQSPWVKLERRGDQVAAFLSTDGSQWTALGSAVLPSVGPVFVGLVGGSQDPTTRLIAILSDVRATRLSTLPDQWSSSDIGGSLIGSSQYVSGMFVALTGAGTANGTADNLRFIHTRVTGDLELIARVVSGGASGKAEAGVMVRGSLAADAATVTLAISKTGTRVVKRRVAAGLPLQEASGAPRVAPWWLKIVKRGTLITTFESANGTTWTPVSSDVLSLPSSFYLGLSTVGLAGSVGQAVFDRVAIRATAANRPPEVALTAPLQGLQLKVGVSLQLAAAATDPDDRVDAVEFYVDGRLVGADTSTPYGATWSSVTAGTYVVSAVAVDSDGARVTSAPKTVVVAAASNGASTSTPRPPANSGASPTGNPGPTPPSPAVPPVVPPVVVAPAPPLAKVSPWRLVFAPSPDHNRIVDRYRLEVYALSPRRLVYGQDLGRPAVVGGDCTVDVSKPFSALVPGSYEAVVTAVDDATYLSSVGAKVSFTR